MIVRIFTLLILCCSISRAEEIPLNQIWAHSMPGTRKISELESDQYNDKSLMAEIRKQHRFKSWQDKAGPAFAVKGIGLDALKNAHAVITGKQGPDTALHEGDEVSVVFFSLEFGYYVHLTKVDKEENTIRVRYEFVPHYTDDLTRHFAIIPVGKLPKGSFAVDISAEPFVRRNVGKEFKEIPDERKLPLVSSSFEFAVQ